jgi:hypothetical protein
MASCSFLSSTPCSCIVLTSSLLSLMRRSISIKCYGSHVSFCGEWA